MDCLPAIDFGPIHGECQPTSCNEKECKVGDDVISQYKLFAYADGINQCGRYRFFFVSLVRDGSWIINFSDGTPLDDQQLSIYSDQIRGAQNKLLNERRWFELGKGMGIWDPNLRRGIQSDTNTEYYPSGNFNSVYSGSGIMDKQCI